MSWPAVACLSVLVLASVGSFFAYQLLRTSDPLLDSPLVQSVMPVKYVFRSKEKGKDPGEEDARLGQVYTKVVTLTQPVMFKFLIKSNPEFKEGDALNLHVASEKVRPDFPLLLSIRTQTQGLSWRLPAAPVANDTKEGEVVSAHLNRTICEGFGKKRKKPKGMLVEVEVASFNLMSTRFTLSVTIAKDFEIKTETREKLPLLDPNTVLTYHGTIPHDIEYSLLEVNSDDRVCMTIFVQDSCPTFDNRGRVSMPPKSLRGDQNMIYQTADSRAGLALSREQFGEDFYLTVQVHDDDRMCHLDELQGGGKREKKVEVYLGHGLTKGQFNAAVYGLLGFVGIFYGIVGGIFAVMCYRKKRAVSSNGDLNQAYGGLGQPAPEPSVSSPIIEEMDDPIPSAPTQEPSIVSTDPGTSEGNNQTYPDVRSMKRELLEQQRRPFFAATQSESQNALVLYSGDRQQHNEDDDEEEEQDEISVNQPSLSPIPSIRIERMQASTVSAASHNWVQLASAGAFFAIPVVQLMRTNQKLSNLTGDQDACYHNFLCAHLGSGMKDFNHIFSNVVYLALGLLFCIVNLIKRFLEEKRDESFGLPCQRDCYSLLGLSLCFEGIMSACYHVCPTKSNLQFDVLFIYILLIVLLIKNYRISHSSASDSRVLSATMLATLTASVAGTCFENLAAMIVFLLVAFVSAPCYSVMMYYRGPWITYERLRWFALPSVSSWRSQRYALVSFGMNLVALAIGSVLIAGEGFISDVPSMLFVLLALNVVFSCFHTYKTLLAKRVSLEEGFQTALAAAFLVLAFAAWIGAFVCYVGNSYDTALSPAASRRENSACEFVNFYDYHDVWHICSAVAAFCTFMGLMFLDESLNKYPRRDLIEAFTM